MIPDSEYWHSVGVGCTNTMLKSSNSSSLILLETRPPEADNANIYYGMIPLEATVTDEKHEIMITRHNIISIKYERNGIITATCL